MLLWNLLHVSEYPPYINARSTTRSPGYIIQWPMSPRNWSNRTAIQMESFLFPFSSFEVLPSQSWSWRRCCSDWSPFISNLCGFRMFTVFCQSFSNTCELLEDTLFIWAICKGGSYYIIIILTNILLGK